MLITDGLLPRAYGVPKIHKDGCPLRIIVSSLKNHHYELTCFLHNIIKNSIPEAFSAVGNSYNLVKLLNGKLLGSNCTFASLDVVSLFTNVPLEWVFVGISNRWQFIRGNTSIPKHEFIRAIKLILDSTYFSFETTVYRQTFGTPMGSPLSPIVADLVLQYLESKALERFPLGLPIYLRYVDDILLAAPINSLPKILETFNSFHDRLQFTLEISKNNCINFLDVTILLEDQRIIFDRYEKPTNSRRYVNFHSRHPLTQKKSIIFGLVDRTLFLSHSKFHEKNFKNVVDTLLDNCYPLPFIFSTIHTRIRMLSHRPDFACLGNIKNKKK